MQQLNKGGGMTQLAVKEEALLHKLSKIKVWDNQNVQIRIPFSISVGLVFET